MRLFVLIALLVMTTMSFAEVKIAAVIPKEHYFSATSIDMIHAKQFPLPSYDVGIMISDFKLLKSNDNSLDMTGYNTLILKGKLKLIAYNPKTEHYQFKFTFEPISGLMHLAAGFVSDIKGKEIRGDVLFDANNKPSIILEGEIQHNNDKPIPDLMYLITTKETPTEIIIATSRDIPITIKSAPEGKV